MTRKEAIKPDDIQVTYSRSPNLKDILIKGSLEDKHQPRGTTPCGNTRCKTCDHIQSGSTIMKEQETYQIRVYMPIKKCSIFTDMQDMQ